MKILLANVAVAEQGSESEQFVENVLVPQWRRNLDLVKQNDTELTFRKENHINYKSLFFMEEVIR